MSIQDFQAMGALVPTRPYKRTLEVDKPILRPKEEWADPDCPEPSGETERVTIDVYFKRISSADEIAIAQADDSDRAFVMAHRLVRNEDGTPLFESVEQASTLASWLLVPIVQQIEVMAGASPKKPTARRMTSGSKLPSHSAGEPRKSGKRQ